MNIDSNPWLCHGLYWYVDGIESLPPNGLFCNTIVACHTINILVCGSRPADQKLLCWYSGRNSYNTITAQHIVVTFSWNPNMIMANQWSFVRMRNCYLPWQVAGILLWLSTVVYLLPFTRGISNEFAGQWEKDLYSNPGNVQLMF